MTPHVIAKNIVHLFIFIQIPQHSRIRLVQMAMEHLTMPVQSVRSREAIATKKVKSPKSGIHPMIQRAQRNLGLHKKNPI